MKTLLVLALFGASAAPNPYPIRYRVEESHVQKHLFFTSGWGAGNLIDSDGQQGFTYTYSGCAPIVTTNQPGYHQGRWKSDHEFVVPILYDNGHVSECALQVTMKPVVYAVKNGVLTASQPFKMRQGYFDLFIVVCAVMGIAFAIARGLNKPKQI
jgi:hypothetical protein